MLLLFSSVSSVSNFWIEGERKIQGNQRARAALELLSREVTPAVVDTRMQFVIGPGSDLGGSGAQFVPEDSPYALWMAPIGKNGELRCCGFFLSRNTETEKYRLKRIFVESENPHGYFPNVFEAGADKSTKFRTSPTDSDWFIKNWDQQALNENYSEGERSVVSTVADGVIALWIQGFDILGNPIPHLSKSKNHPNSDLHFNSAAFFHMATSVPFDDGESFVYLAETDFTMKAHRLPAELEITIVTVGDAATARFAEIPPPENIFRDNGSMDVEKSLNQFLQALEQAEIPYPETYSVRTKLVNGG